MVTTRGATTRDHAARAAAQLAGLLGGLPDGIAAEALAAIVERTLQAALTERDAAHRRRTEKLVAGAREQLDRLLGSSPAVIYSFRATGDFGPTFVSANLRRVFGYPPSEYLDNPAFWRERVHPADLARVEAEVERLFGNGVHILEYRFRKGDGSFCWVSDQQQLIRDKRGAPLEIVGSWSDISLRRQAEEERGAAHRRLLRLLTSSPAVIYSFQAAGDFAPTFVSDNLQDVLGYAPQEYLADADFWRSRVHPDDLAEVEASSAQLYLCGHHAVEYRFRRRDGSYCWVEDTQQLARDADGRPEEVVGSWSDITERKEAEAALATARLRVEHLLASSPAVIYSFKASGDYAPTFISSNVKDLLGYDRAEYLESPDFWASRVHPEDQPRITRAYARLLDEGHLSSEYRFRRKDGSYCWVSDELRVLRDAAGTPVEVVGAWSDVTARKQLGEALVAAQDRLVHLLSSAPAVIYSFRAFGDFGPTFVSQNIKDWLGYEPEEYLEDPDFWRRRVHPEDLAAAEAASLHLFRKGRHTLEYRFRRRDGTYCWVNDEQHLIRDPDGEPIEVVGSWSDVTARNEAEIAFRRSEQRLTDAIESISEGFSLYDADDRLIVCNRVYSEILYPGMGAPAPGTSFEAVIRGAAGQGLVLEAKGRVEAWVAERLARHSLPGEPELQRRADGRWVQISERKTTEGGTVAVYTDITDIKRAEEELRAANSRTEMAHRQLSEKNQALEVLSTKLSKYLAPQVYSSIFSGERSVEIASARKQLSVFFSDIVDFTAITEDLESEELTSLLNHYLTEMARIALAHGATIDKYVGDACLFFFGDPESRGVRQDAEACVLMAIAMQRRMRELQALWRDAGRERPFELRIGISTGYCTVGNFGSEDRMDYTIIGREVNLAARLQAFAPPGGILLSHATWSLVKDCIRAEERPRVEVKGFTKPVRSYEVLGTAEAAERPGGLADGQIVAECQGLRVAVDLDKVSRDAAVAVLEQALARLRG